MLNRVILIGRLTRDPELRKTPSGLAVASFSLAVDDSRKQPDGTKNTLFMNCSLFGQRAEIFVKYVRKGSMVSVEGRLNQRKYTRKDGVQMTTIDTIVDNFDFLDSKGMGPNNGDAVKQSAPAEEEIAQPDGGNLDSIDVVDDDLPF